MMFQKCKGCSGIKDLTMQNHKPDCASLKYFICFFHKECPIDRDCDCGPAKAGEILERKDNPCHHEASEEWEKEFMDFYMETGKYAGRPLGPDQYISFIRSLLAAKDKEIEEMKDEFARKLNSEKKSYYELGKAEGELKVLKEICQAFSLKADTPEEKV